MLVELGDKELSLCWCFAGHGVLVGLGDKELTLCWPGCVDRARR